MDKKDFIKRVWAGTFFLTGIILVIGMVLVIGIERGLTESKFSVTVLYREIGGLALGAPVALSGVHVGTVGRIDFLDDEVEGRGVAVTLEVFKKYEKQLFKATRVVIKTEGVLGEKVVDISRDSSMPTLDITKPVIGEDPLNVQDLAKIMGESATAMQDTSREVNRLMKVMENISEKSKRLLNRIEQRIIDGNLFKVF